MERIAIADFADVEPARPRLLSLIDEEQPDNLCVRIGVDRLLADAQLALNPIAILLDSERLPLKPISFTEWQHATSSPRFFATARLSPSIAVPLRSNDAPRALSGTVLDAFYS